MALPTITSKQKALRAAQSDEGYKQLRSDYSRLRAAEAKRIQRAQAAGYLKNGIELPTLKDIGSDRAALAAEYSRLSKLIESETTTVGKLKDESRRRAESFQKLGYKFVTEKNEKQFGEFMGYMIEKYSENTEEGKKLLLDSDIIVEGFDYVRERTKSTNHSTMSRLFNDFLRGKGLL